MGRLAEQDDPRVPDPIEDRIDRTGLDVVDWLRGFTHECGETRGASRAGRGRDDVRAFLGPCLFTDERHEPDTRERLFSIPILPLAGDPYEHLRGDVFTDRNHETTADCQLRQERGRRLRPSGGDRNRVVGCVLGPAERAVPTRDMHVGEAET